MWVFLFDLFDPDLGPVNKVLAFLGLTGFEDFSWTYDRLSAFALVLLEVVWCSFPFVMVTVYAGIIPLFFLLRDAGAAVPGVGLNTLGSLILPHLAFSLPFAIWMPRGFVRVVPPSPEEAACIDGAGRARFLWQILFPLALPGPVATSVFSSVSTWNDFLCAKSFTLSATGNSTLPMALLVFFKPDENDRGGIMAASIVLTIPVLVFFVLVQRRLVSGLGGAVKD